MHLALANCLGCGEAAADCNYGETIVRKNMILGIGAAAAIITTGGLVYANASGDGGEQYCKTPSGYIRLSATGECKRRETPVDMPTADDFNAVLARVDELASDNLKLRADLDDLTKRLPSAREANGYLVLPRGNLSGLVPINTTLTGVDLSDAYLFKANLAGVDLIQARLINADLGEANLSGATLDKATLLYANMAAANLQGAYLQDAHLIGANLSGANLLNAIATGANFGGVNLSSANLTGARLTGVRSGGITGSPASMPAGWSLVLGYLIGPQANLTEANLNGANLTGVNFTGARLTGVSSGAITGTPAALPTNWSLVAGYLVGPGANLFEAALNDADLTASNLTNANMWGANLARANLTRANLNGADLGGADLSDVQSSGIIGTPASLPDGWSLIDGTLIYTQP